LQGGNINTVGSQAYRNAFHIRWGTVGLESARRNSLHQPIVVSHVVHQYPMPTILQVIPYARNGDIQVLLHFSNVIGFTYRQPCRGNREEQQERGEYRKSGGGRVHILKL